MLQAHIVSPRGSLYYAGECTAYDLETVRQHLRDALPDAFPGDVQLEVVVEDVADETRVALWLEEFHRAGIRTHLLVDQPPECDGEPVAIVA